MLGIGRVAAICTVAAGCGGCLPAHLAVLNGDATGAEISYAGDYAAAAALAQKHCAQYDRIARYLGRDTDRVDFECDRR